MKIFGYGPDMRVSISDLQDEFNQMFNRLWHGGVVTGPLDGQDWAPRIDLIDEPDQFLVRAEIPGIAAAGVDVSITGNTLTLKGQKPAPLPEGAQGKIVFSETRCGSFCRDVAFPQEVRPDGIQATAADGVLIISVPKAESAKPRSVRVEVKPGPQ